MKVLGFVAAMTSLSANTAHGQTASEAFQCELPYQATMMTVGSLEVESQTTVAPFPGLHGEGELIQFAPVGTQVFGASPEQLSLEFLPPHPWQAKQKFVIKFAATFAKSPATDDAIQQSVEWHIACGTLEFCIRSAASRPDGAGRLEYNRKDKLALECIFEFTPEEIEALGN